jgi:hypothetical protein
MTTAPTLPPSAPRADARPADPAREADPRVAQEQRDRFEHLLQARSARGEEHEDEVPSTEPCAGALPLVPPAELKAARAAAGTPAPAAVETVQTGARAAIEAALNAGLPAPVAAAGAPESAAVWEASVSEPASVAVQVRLTRPERAAHEAQPGWTLTVGSPAVGAEMLSRHAPRLAERLARRAIGIDHVRIQREDGDA